MTFSLIDLFSGILLCGAIIHLVIARLDLSFPSLFGKTPKANFYHSLLMASIAIDIHFFRHGLDMTLSNGMLVGITSIYILYAIFGKRLHKMTLDRSKPVSGTDILPQNK